MKLKNKHKATLAGVGSIASLGAVPLLDPYVSGFVASAGVLGTCLASTGYFGHYAWKNYKIPDEPMQPEPVSEPDHQPIQTPHPIVEPVVEKKKKVGFLAKLINTDIQIGGKKKEVVEEHKPVLPTPEELRKLVMPTQADKPFVKPTTEEDFMIEDFQDWDAVSGGVSIEPEPQQDIEPPHHIRKDREHLESVLSDEDSSEENDSSWEVKVSDSKPCVSDSPPSPPALKAVRHKCAACSKMAKQTPYPDGAYYCKRHIPEVYWDD